MAEIKWAYEKSSGRFLYGGHFEPHLVTPLSVDALGSLGTGNHAEGVVTLPRHPDPRTERYDGAGGIRPATAAEIAEFDNEDWRSRLAKQLVGKTVAQLTDAEVLAWAREKMAEELGLG